MNQALHTAPVCEKHGCEKKWINDRSHKAGGAWKCNQCRNKAFQLKTGAKPRILAPLKSDSPPICQKHKCNFVWRNCKSIEAKGQWQCPECSKERTSKWRKANSSKNCARVQRRRARKHNATVPGRHVTAAIEAERKALFGGCCFCDSQEKLTLEHMVALNNGGLHVEENLFGSCKSCNSSKNDKPVEQWFRSQPFFSVERWERLNEVTYA